MTTSVPTTKPPGDGWMLWSDPYAGFHGVPRKTPYDYVEVETWRSGWTGTSLQEPEAHPMMNANGLYWRPAGPERSPEEKMRRALETLMRR
jgi:hypothetical protein